MREKLTACEVPFRKAPPAAAPDRIEGDDHVIRLIGGKDVRKNSQLASRAAPKSGARPSDAPQRYTRAGSSPAIGRNAAQSKNEHAVLGTSVDWGDSTVVKQPPDRGKMTCCGSKQRRAIV